MGAVVCAYLEMSFFRQVRGLEIFPRCFKSLSAFLCQFWELLKGETALSSKLPRWQHAQLRVYSNHQKVFPCSKAGKLKSAASQMMCNPLMSVCLPTAGELPQEVQMPLQVCLLCLHLHPGEKGLRLLLLLHWTNGALPSRSFRYCSWLCLVALVFHKIRVSGCFWIISMCVFAANSSGSSGN